jgi:hypothetical protein
MNCDEIRPLLADRWAGGLKGSDALAYEGHLDSCAPCRAEAERLTAFWRDLAVLPCEEPGGSLRERFEDSLRAYREGMNTAPRRWSAWQLAAAAAILAVGIGAGYGLRPDRGGEEVAELRGEVASMREMVALSLLQQSSASERLRGVSWANRSEPTDGKVLDALVTAVNHDTNVNVRLAAVDAMRAFAGSPAARQAMVDSLSRQDAPLVQVALIDWLVDVKDRNATGGLRELASDTSVNDGVKQRAQWALERLQ